jgi:hypothetical protein
MIYRTKPVLLESKFCELYPELPDIITMTSLALGVENVILD